MLLQRSIKQVIINIMLLIILLLITIISNITIKDRQIMRDDRQTDIQTDR